MISLAVSTRLEVTWVKTYSRNLDSCSSSLEQAGLKRNPTKSQEAGHSTSNWDPSRSFFPQVVSHNLTCPYPLLEPVSTYRSSSSSRWPGRSRVQCMRKKPMRDNPARRVQREYAARRVLYDDSLLESTAKKNSADAKKNTTIRTTSKFPSFSRMLVINQYHPNISEFSDTKNGISWYGCKPWGENSVFQIRREYDE